MVEVPDRPTGLPVVTQDRSREVRALQVLGPLALETVDARMEELERRDLRMLPPPPPPPPPLAEPPTATVTVPNPSAQKRTEATPQSKVDKKQEKADEIARELSVPEGAKALSVETGNASWYGAPYHNRRSSNGEVYDMHALTAAHRTLPLGVDRAGDEP